MNCISWMLLFKFCSSCPWFWILFGDFEIFLSSLWIWIQMPTYF
jgi:hypothetical protein